MREPENVDELLNMIYDFLCALRKHKTEYNYDEMAGKILARATGADERFKRDELVRIFTQVERGKAMIEYLHCPVKFEGILQRKLDGKVYLNDRVIDEGTKIEYMQDGEWAIGVLKQNPDVIGMSIANSMGDVVIETVDQIIARIR